MSDVTRKWTTAVGAVGAAGRLREVSGIEGQLARQGRRIIERDLDALDLVLVGRSLLDLLREPDPLLIDADGDDVALLDRPRAPREVLLEALEEQRLEDLVDRERRREAGDGDGRGGGKRRGEDGRDTRYGEEVQGWCG